MTAHQTIGHSTAVVVRKSFGFWFCKT